MHTKTIVEGLALAVVVIAAIAMLADVIRYMKIRSMWGGRSDIAEDVQIS